MSPPPSVWVKAGLEIVCSNASLLLDGEFMVTLGKHALGVVVAMVLFGASAHAQIIGSITAELPADALASGDPLTGFGFSALRYEDKMRMKRLRERYLELNPVNEGVVEVFDVETAMSNTGNMSDTKNQAADASK